MIAHGTAPYIECSSAGDRRFSAFYAKVHGVSIEIQYQAYKEFKGRAGTVVTGLPWQEAKGRKPLNPEACARWYARLWDQYMAEHPELLDVLKAASGLCDKFGQPGHVCQATELWRIRNA